MFGLSYNTMPHHLAVLHHAWNLLRPGGRLVVFGGTGGPEVTLDVRALYLNWKSIRGTTMGSARDFAGLCVVPALAVVLGLGRGRHGAPGPSPG